MSEETDPRLLGGDIVVPDPIIGDAVVNTERAVLLAAIDSTIVETDERHPALLLEGRVNQTDDEARVLFLMRVEMAASLCAHLASLCERAGLGEDFREFYAKHLGELPADPRPGG